MYQHVFPKSIRTASERPDIIYFANTSSRDVYPPRILHRHYDRCEIILITGGEGEFLVGSRTFPVETGDLVIIEAGDVHDERSFSDVPLDTFCCGISGILQPDLPANHLLPEGTSPVIKSESHYGFLQTAFTYMNDAILARGSSAAGFCSSMMDSVLSVIRHILIDPLDQLPMDGEFMMVDRIRTFLDNHYNEVTGLDEIADSMNVSISYLSHVFKKETGYSPKQYIIMRRIGEAQTLLALTHIPVTDISTTVGYDNSNYFSTLFTKTVGMTPSKYRQFCQSDMLKT